VVDASGSSTGLLINRHPIGAFLSHHEQQVGNSVTISCAQNCCTYCCCTNQLSRTTIVVRTIINYQSLLMHSVSMFTVLSYCCRTILCDKMLLQSVCKVLVRSFLRSIVHIIMLRHSTSTLCISISTVHAHYGPPGESGQHQQVVKLYSHSTKQIS